MRLLPVPPEHVETTFRILRDEVASIVARSNGRFLTQDLAAAIIAGEMLAWVVVTDDHRLLAVVLAEIRVYPRTKVCRLVACAGRERKKWLHLLSEIEAWAASVGCTQMHAEARKGWAGELTEYKVTHLILEKDISHEQRRIEDADGHEQPGSVEWSTTISYGRVPAGADAVQRRAADVLP